MSKDISSDAMYLLGCYWEDRGMKLDYPTEGKEGGSHPKWGVAQQQLETVGLIHRKDAERWNLTDAGLAFCTLVNPGRTIR